MTDTADVLFVGHGHPRYQEELATWADRLRALDCAVTTTTPRTWYGEEVLGALSEPRQLVVYFGHGKPGQWLGYARLTAETIGDLDLSRPHRLVASLCCHGLSSPADGPGIPEAVLNGGVATRLVGHRGRVRFAQNRSCLRELLAAYCEARKRDVDGVYGLLDAVSTTSVAVCGRPRTDGRV